MKLRFRFLMGDHNWLTYGGKWHSKRLHNGDFPYWLVIELINMDEACGRENAGHPRYYVTLCAVSPEAAKDNLNQALESCGLAGEICDLAKVEALHSYGIRAVLWQENGSNAHQLLHLAREEASKAAFLFGFYMDRPENRIGSTGWELIKGDLDSALHRTIASNSTEGKILGKMYGVQS